MPESTVYKLLARNGLTRKQTSQDKDHRRFSYQYAGDLWMSDVMHGPAIKDNGGRKRKTYLIAFIDDATRVIPYAAFAHSENTASFMEVFQQAILRRGIPQRLFVDYVARNIIHIMCPFLLCGRSNLITCDCMDEIEIKDT